METRGGIYLQSRERKKGQEPGIQGRAEQHSTGKSKRRCGGVAGWADRQVWFLSLNNSQVSHAGDGSSYSSFNLHLTPTPQTCAAEG